MDNRREMEVEQLNDSPRKRSYGKMSDFTNKYDKSCLAKYEADAWSWQQGS